MGVDVDDCFIVGRLLGTKLFATEFIAFLDLGKLVRNRHELTQYNGTLIHDVSGNIFLEATNSTLIGGVISVSGSSSKRNVLRTLVILSRTYVMVLLIL